MIFEQCKGGRYFAWAGRDPGIKSPVNENLGTTSQLLSKNAFATCLEKVVVLLTVRVENHNRRATPLLCYGC